jgi:hypothetical protein
MPAIAVFDTNVFFPGLDTSPKCKRGRHSTLAYASG